MVTALSVDQLLVAKSENQLLAAQFFFWLGKGKRGVCRGGEALHRFVVLTALYVRNMQLQICSAVSVAKVVVAKGCVQSPSPKLALSGRSTPTLYTSMRILPFDRQTSYSDHLLTSWAYGALHAGL